MQLSATEKVSVLEKEREAVENNTILSKISMHQSKNIISDFSFPLSMKNKEKIQVIKGRICTVAIASKVSNMWYFLRIEKEDFT